MNAKLQNSGFQLTRLQVASHLQVYHLTPSCVSMFLLSALATSNSTQEFQLQQSWSKLHNIYSHRTATSWTVSRRTTAGRRARTRLICGARCLHSRATNSSLSSARSCQRKEERHHNSFTNVSTTTRQRRPTPGVHVHLVFCEWSWLRVSIVHVDVTHEETMTVVVGCCYSRTQKNNMFSGKIQQIPIPIPRRSSQVAAKQKQK